MIISQQRQANTQIRQKQLGPKNSTQPKLNSANNNNNQSSLEKYKTTYLNFKTFS